MSPPRGSLGNYVDHLLAAAQRGEIELRFNLIALNSPGQPTHSAFENSLLLILPLLIAGLAFYWSGWIWALIGFAAGLIVSLVFVRRWIFSRAQIRAVRLLRGDESAMLDFWRDGMLMLHHRPSGSDCVLPDGDWRAFVREHLLIGR